MILKPLLPFFNKFRVIKSQSIISIDRLFSIKLTSVDFPQAIPPVSPRILTFLSFLPIRKTTMMGKRVERKESISQNRVLARMN